MGINGEKSVKLGDIVDFGGYAWLVLDIQDGQALLLSQLVLENRPYNEEDVPITWEKCTLRRYLNGEFYEKFSAADRERIIQTDVKNEDNQWFGTPDGVQGDTADYIFLLSIEEVVRYFGDSGKLESGISNEIYETCIDDEFNKNRIAKDSLGATVTWWLRSNGDYDRDAAGVYLNGCLYLDGGHVLAGCGVRPALWVDLCLSSDF